MVRKEIYEQPICEIIAFTSDAIRTSDGEEKHFIADEENWGIFETGETN